MEKTNGYYVAKYLKNNALVLLCELVVVLLLSLICTIIMEAEPLWLAPVIAVVTYLVAEVRFMMAYVATNARHEHDMAVAKGELVEDEQEPAEQEDEQEEATPVADAALFMAVAAAAAEQDEEPTKQNEVEEEELASDVEDTDEADEAEETEEVFDAEDADDAEQEESVEPEADDDFSREVRLQLDKFLSTPKEQPVEQNEQENDEQVEQDGTEQEPDGEDMAEPVFDELPPRVSLEIDDEDEAMDALFGAPVFEQDDEKEPDIVLESLEIADDDLDDMTMDDDDFARDVLEIGEIEAAAPSDDEQ